MATHSSILAWEIPWIEKPGRLHTDSCMGSQRVRQNLATTQQQLRNRQPPENLKKKNPSFFFFVMSVSFKDTKGLKLPIYKQESLLP